MTTRTNALSMVQEEYDALMQALARLDELSDFAGEDELGAEASDLMNKIAAAVVDHRKAVAASKG